MCRCMTITGTNALYRFQGHLVPDFLRSDGNSDAYIESIAMGSAQYNLFNFVSLENRFVSPPALVSYSYPLCPIVLPLFYSSFYA